MIILGIDPGNKGALAFLNSTTNKLVATYKMPTAYREAKKNVDEDALAEIVRRHSPDVGVIEDVFSRPTDGRVGVFTFGQGKGILIGCLAALGVERTYVAPNKWKKDMGVTSDKTTSKLLARTLYSDNPDLTSTEGKCEAILIALWYALKLQAPQKT